MLQKFIDKAVGVSNWVLFFTSITFFILASVLITHIEEENFKSYFDGFWWVMTTVTTVGFGDLVPETVPGRIIGLILYTFGIGLIGIIIGKILDGLMKAKTDREEGRIVFKGEEHIVIIGWSDKARGAIEELLETNKDIEIVLVDELEKAPMFSDHIHYVRGNITSGEPLHRANIQKSQAVLIFSNEKIIDKELADGMTLLIASTVESIAPNTHTVVEVMNQHHIETFKHVKVNEFVVSDDTISSLFVRAAFRRGISSVYNQLLRRAYGDDLYYVKTSPDWITYGDAFRELIEKGATLIADRDSLGINRMLDQPIPEKAELYVICDKETYEKIRKDYSF